MKSIKSIIVAALCALLIACSASPQDAITITAPDTAASPTPSTFEAVQRRRSTEPLPASEALGIVKTLSHPDARVHIPYALLENPPAEIPVIFHFHQGFNWLSEEIHTHHINAILVWFSPGGLSSKYKTPIVEDPELFERLIAEALDAAHAQPQIPDNAPMGSLTVTSFSAGFGAVRELLKDPDLFNAIDHIVLADTLYAGYTGDPSQKQVDPDNMVNFLRFAKHATEGDKHMIITHNSYDPPGYASTAETADYLIEKLNLTRYPVNYPVGLKLTHTSRAGKGNFEIFTSPRTDGSDHAMHLRYIGFPLSMLPLPTTP